LLARGTHPLPLLSSFFLLQSPFLFPSFSFYAFLFPLFEQASFFFRMIFSVTRPYVFICQALAPIPLGFAPYPLKIDTLESFKG